MTVTMKHSDRTGISREEIMRRAKKLRADARRRKMEISLQDAVDCVIDAAIEYAQ